MIVRYLPKGKRYQQTNRCGGFFENGLQHAWSLIWGKQESSVLSEGPCAGMLAGNKAILRT